MTTLKGFKKLNKTVSEELKQFGIKNSFLGDGYSYDFNSNSISWTLIEDESDEAYNDFLLDRFGYKATDDDIFFISLMHEVGHSKTEDDIDGFTYEYCQEEKDRISIELGEAITKEEKKKLHYQYFYLPDEFSATAWAMNFIKKHPKKSKNIRKRLEKAIFEFYDANID